MLYAIFKNKEHRGNIRAVNKKSALLKYLLDAKLITLKDPLPINYTCIPAIQGIHF